MVLEQQFINLKPVSDEQDKLICQLTNLIDNDLAGLLFVDINGIVRVVNAYCCQLLGIQYPVVQGRSFADLLPDNTDALRIAVAQVMQGEALPHLELYYNHQNLLANCSRVSHTDGSFAGVRLVLVDMSQFQQAMCQLRLAEERSRFALESAGQWTWDMDIKTNRVWRSPQHARVLGLDIKVPQGQSLSWDIVFSEDKAIAMQALDDVITGKCDLYEAVYRVLKHDGEPLWILSRGRVVEWDEAGTPTRLLATSVDISGQKQIEAQLSLIILEKAELERKLIEINRTLRKQSEYDYLTNLPNRRKFSQHLRLEFMHAQENQKPLSILMIDVDYFKAFNDLYGHLAGDKCLTDIGQVLSAVISQQQHVVARFGGEEFVVILADTAQAEAAVIAQTIVDSITDMKIPHTGSSFSIVTASIGVGTFDAQNNKTITDPYALLNLADKALYKAKGTGRNGVRVWDTEESK
ncbi:sensor domain-containing diguanylate cyclase [Pseudochrobactrum sp. MP213Fo]|uniref:sensor domain-containing diguanylate cyclase n=1 Tax=Pseudochrobactrum sp. MP213Fo TaxID=3022250 RepID=UPI003B9F1633